MATNVEIVEIIPEFYNFTASRNVAFFQEMSLSHF